MGDKCWHEPHIDASHDARRGCRAQRSRDIAAGHLEKARGAEGISSSAFFSCASRSRSRWEASVPAPFSLELESWRAGELEADSDQRALRRESASRPRAQ